MRKVYDCKPEVEDSRDEKLAEEVFSEETVKSGSRSSVSGALLYRKDALAVLGRQLATGSLQDVFFNF